MNPPGYIANPACCIKDGACADITYHLVALHVLLVPFAIGTANIWQCKVLDVDVQCHPCKLKLVKVQQ